MVECARTGVGIYEVIVYMAGASACIRGGNHGRSDGWEGSKSLR